MSDYVHERALRCPITENECSMIRNMKDYMGMKKIKNVGYFDTNYTESGVYLDYVIYHSYGEECGEWIKSRDLYDSEKEAFKHLFQQFFPNINMSCVKLVDYCWYNCCEPPDCYDPKSDSFYRPISLEPTAFISCYMGDENGAQKCMRCGLQLDSKDMLDSLKYCPQCGSCIT